MSEELAVYERPVPILQLKEQVGIIQKVMKEIMQEGTHYGVIPGCKQPSLYKAGAEKIAVTFRLSVVPVIIEDLSTPDCVRYRVTSECRTPDGRVIGAAAGEASSHEEKYRWRKPICNEEFNETSDHLKREKWVAGWKNEPAKKIKQIQTDPATQANTILQMADKRSYVACVRRCTAASDVFTQDIQDLPAEYIQGESDQPAPPQSKKPVVAPPQAKQAAPQNTADESAEPPADLPLQGETSHITEKQRKLVYARYKGAGVSDEEFKDYLSRCINVASTKEIPFERINEVLEWIEIKKQAA